MVTDAIPGYAYGAAGLAPSPVSLDALELLKATVLFTAEDVAALRMSHDVLAPHLEEILDVWYGFVGSHPHLLAAFADAQGTPDATYLARVRARFGRWILDTARAEYDDAWLAYQHEIGLRHHRTKKNQTDAARAAEHVPFRYLVALLYPVTATLRPFLAKGGHSQQDVDRKSVV